MLNKTSMLLAATVVALSAGAASAAHHNNGHNNSNVGAALALGFANIAFGYNDGYWDTGHRWHRWGNTSDYQNYRAHGSNFHGWNHTRDRDNGWQRH